MRSLLSRKGLGSIRLSMVIAAALAVAIGVSGIGHDTPSTQTAGGATT